MEMMGVLAIYQDSQGLSIPFLRRLPRRVSLGSRIVYDDETVGFTTAQHIPTRVEGILRRTRFGETQCVPETTE